MKYTKAIYLSKLFERNPEFKERFDYSEMVYRNAAVKIRIRCREHEYFEILPGDHRSGLLGCKACAKKQRAQSLTEKYGVDNYFKRNDLIQSAMQKKHGVTNPGLLPNHREKIRKTNIERYGVEWITSLPEIQEKTKKTNLKRFGVDHPMKDPIRAKQATATKVANGGFNQSNTSKEATQFILNYIQQKGYDLSQCAFAYQDQLHEWGLYHSGRWVLFDLVVFHPGHRGDKNHIIEILEYHGPFHYHDADVSSRGDDLAYPWKTNKTTIRESVNRDREKEVLAKSLTSNFTVVWAGREDANTKEEGDV